jgi:hypothetical protein
MIDRVAEEEVVAVAADAEQARLDRAALQQVGAFDECEPVVAGDAAGEQRRHREEQLVHEACAQKRPGEPGPALREDEAVTAVAQAFDGGGRVE